jgi:hypothetical protein
MLPTKLISPTLLFFYQQRQSFMLGKLGRSTMKTGLSPGDMGSYPANMGICQYE